MAAGRVLLVNNKAGSTGVGVYALELFKHLRQIAPKMIDMVDLLQGSNESAFAKMMAPISMFWKLPKNDHRLVLHFLSANLGLGIALGNPTIFTLHDLAPFLSPLVRERVVWSKGKDLPLLWAMRLNTYFLKYASLVICQTHTTKSEALKLLNLRESRIRVIYPGIDRDTFRPRPKLSARRMLNLPTDKRIVLNISVDEPRKNIATLLLSFKRLIRTYPDTILVRIGRHAESTEHLIRLLGLRDKIVEIETTAATAPYYNAADVFAFPSLYEGLGRPLLESMASGCPIVASNVNPIPEVLGNVGLTCDPLDVDALARMLSEFLSATNDGFVEDAIRNGLERSKSFDWNDCAMATRSLYGELLR